MVDLKETFDNSINNKIRTEADGELLWSLAYASVGAKGKKDGWIPQIVYEKYFTAKISGDAAVLWTNLGNL